MSDVALFRKRTRHGFYFAFTDYNVLSESLSRTSRFGRIDLLLLDYYCRHAEFTVTWKIKYVFLTNTIADIDMWMQLLGCIATLPFLRKVVIRNAKTRLEGEVITLDEYSLAKIDRDHIFMGNVLSSLMMQSTRIIDLIADGCGLTRADVKLIMHVAHVINSARYSFGYYVDLIAREEIERYEPVLNTNEHINFLCSDISLVTNNNVFTLSRTYDVREFVLDNVKTLSLATKKINESKTDIRFYLSDISFQKVAKINSIMTSSKIKLDRVTDIVFSCIYQSPRVCDAHLPEFVYLAKNLKSLSIFHSPFLLS